MYYMIYNIGINVSLELSAISIGLNILHVDLILNASLPLYTH